METVSHSNHLQQVTCEARCCTTSRMFRLFSLHHFLPFHPSLHSSNRRRRDVIDSRAGATFPSDVRSTFARPVIYASQVHVRHPGGKVSDDAGI